MIPTELIESALSLTSTDIRMVDNIVGWDEGTDDFATIFSIEKFCYYLLSESFIEKYIPIAIKKIYYSYNEHFDDAEARVIREFAEAINYYQKGNEQPLVDLLTKI